MRRTYSRERYLRLVDELRAAIPDLALTTDLIVGFPGETEAEFEETVERGRGGRLRRRLHLRLLAAPGHGGRGDGRARCRRSVKRERIERLIEVVQRVAEARNRERVGRVEEVLVEGPSRTDPAVLRGRTRRNTTVNFAGHGRAGRARPGHDRGRHLDHAQGHPARRRCRLAADLTWDGCLNVRELGGLPTADGGETRCGSIVRADSVRQLSDEGWRALVDHGVRTVIDLRGDHEREDDPPAELPVEVVHVPFMEASEAEWEEIAEEIEAAAAAAPDVATSTRDVYLIFLERFRRQRRRRRCERSRTRPRAASSSTASAARTELACWSAFLLHLAGVDDETIAADYALSEERLLPRHEAWFAAAESEEELERLRRIAQTPAASMDGRLRRARAPLRRRRGLPARRRRERRGARPRPRAAS